MTTEEYQQQQINETFAKTGKIWYSSEDKDFFFIKAKADARTTALKFSPSYKNTVDNEGNRDKVPLTAEETILQAEILYNWLIKDLDK